MPVLLSTKEVAKFLNVNEKMVYSLIQDKGLPATKVTGKWLFPQHLVERWVENSTVNHPGEEQALPPYNGLLIVVGSNDLLLDKTMALFKKRYGEGHTVVFGNTGSVGGLKALRRGLCHLACSHLVQDDEEFNFSYAAKELEEPPALVNFCRREQGFLVAKGNPEGIAQAPDTVRSIAEKGLTVVNRSKTTGTRVLFDRELKREGIDPATIKGYDREVNRHLDVGLEVLSGRAHCGPGIRAVAGILDLDFIPVHWERFDLLAAKERFFDKGVQLFLNMLVEPEFKAMANELPGYDTSLSGKMVFPA